MRFKRQNAKNCKFQVVKIEIRVLQKITNQPLWNEEAVFDQDSDEEKQKSLNDHHKNISACDVPTEWIPNQVYA